MFIRVSLLVTALILISVPFEAQIPPSHEKGLSSNTAYQFGDLDSTNLFNGNLVLRIPIGQPYPVTTSFAYGLTLTYNANGWDYRDDRRCVFDGSVERYVVPRQDPHTNAGFGWQLQIGQLYPPGIEDFTGSGWLYVSPDGAEHGLGTELHPGHPATPQPNTYFSTDGTYLRLRHYPTGASNPCRTSAACATLETRETDFHLETGIMKWRLGGEAVDSTFVMPSRDTPWIWTTFAEQRLTEGGQTSTTQFCFDRSTGFLERQRILAGSSPATNDLLTIFESERDGGLDTGQVGRELSFGDDGGGLSRANDLCSLSLPALPSFGRVGTIRPPGANPPTDFTYHGERATTRKLWIQTSLDGTRSQSYSTEVQDSFGRLAEVCENRSASWSGHCNGGLLTTYAYDEGDRLTKVCQNANGTICGQERHFTYDNRGFLLAERHPEIGPFGNGWTDYTYDARGNVVTRKIAGTQDFNLEYRYDRAGRLVRIEDVSVPTDRRPMKAFFYARTNSGTNQKAGKLVLAKRYNYVDILPPLPSRRTGSIPVVISDAYEYKGRDGRTSKHQMRYQLGVTSYLFDASYSWNEQGNLENLTYPNCRHEPCAGRAPPRTLTFDYERGLLRKVDGYADLIAYQAGGMLRRVPHENGVSDWIDLAGDGLARPHRIRTEGVSNGNWNSGSYVYDGAQNITNIGPLPFAYDLMSRLKSGDVGLNINNTQIRRQTATYDAYGNIQNLTTGGVPETIGANPSTNRLTSAFYDEAGNVVSQNLGNVDHAYDFDPLNMMKHLRTSNDVSRIFIYNANDQRVLTFDCAANVCANDTAKETWTLRGLDGKVLRQYTHPWNAGWHFDRDTIYRDGQLLAHVDDSGDVHHLHLDHLGSPRQITDSTGHQVAFHSYYPFGQEATNSAQNDFALKFTGHERDEFGGSSLDYMMARYYSLSNARFLSVDPIHSAHESLPQSWNKFSSLKNNALKFVDPDGKAADLFLDVGFILYDIGDIATTVLAEEELSSTQIMSLGANVLGAAVPFVTGLGPGIRAAEKTDDTIRLFHGTDIESALGFLNGAALDIAEAAKRKIDGIAGFFLATQADDAAFFAARRGEGAVLEISLSKNAYEELIAAGATIGNIPPGKRIRFVGQEFVISPEIFSVFNHLRDIGEIKIRPGS